MAQALIIIDMQNDYFEGGTMTLKGIDQAAANCRALLDKCRESQKPLFHIQHVMTREGATFFVADTEGVEINSKLSPEGVEPVITKHTPSCFRGTDLHDRLQELSISELIFCGAMTHMCIDTSVRAAFDLGYQCTVIADACATRDLEFDGRAVAAEDVQAAFMAALAVPFAAIKSTEDYLSH